MEKNASELTVLDVYDIATVVGQEFEHIIDQYGCEAVTRIMPKVVRILEMLEILELEQVEDIWRGENQNLLSQIADLEVQNKALRMRLSLKELQHTEENLHKNEGPKESEHQQMRKLKEMVDQQHDEIKAKDHEIALKNTDIETLHKEQHRLMKINQDLKHWISTTEAQGKALIQDRTKLEALSQARQREPRSTGEAPGMQTTVWAECETELDSLVEHFNPLKSLTLLRTHTAKETKEDVHIPYTERSNDAIPSLPKFTFMGFSGQQEALCGDDQAEDERCTSDHKVPRFTLQDLQDVLQEKNKLKAQVFQLQEELTYYKSEEELDELMSPPVPVVLTASQCSYNSQPESGIKKLLFTAVMPMVAAGLINDDPTLQPIRRLISVVMFWNF
ncbi:hypothetical protein NFI96_014455 [Prochilodus magdalenae]|nr:hypothetical protein NFI96_014455 [Prochilodus magdalenae]